MNPNEPERSPSRPVEVVRLGQMSYGEALVHMEQRVEARLKGEVCDALLLVEHVPPVLTLGRRPEGRSHVLAGTEVLRAEGIDIIQTGRGGDITYHGPGQVVGYPIVSLQPERKDVRRYVADLESLMISVCESYGLDARRSPGEIGCWIEGRRKVGAIGVRISRWVTSHGFALNVAPTMRHFGYIVPCGIADKPVTSLAAELSGPPPSMDEVFDRCARAFFQRFGSRVV